jgi:hypothetical protein
MKERTRRLAIAFVLSIANVAVFKSYASEIWQTFGQKPLAQFGLIALLGLWVSSAGIIWFHISNDVRDTFRQLNRTLSRDITLDLSEPTGDNNV